MRVAVRVLPGSTHPRHRWATMRTEDGKAFLGCQRCSKDETDLFAGPSPISSSKVSHPGSAPQVARRVRPGRRALSAVRPLIGYVPGATRRGQSEVAATAARIASIEA